MTHGSIIAPATTPSQATNSGGFAAVPHRVASDPRLSATDVRVYAGLLFYAKRDPTCRPSDASLAEYACVHPSTVRRSLARLEAFGHIRRNFFAATKANPTGRTIHLSPEHTCAPCAETPNRPCTPCASTPSRPRAPVHADKDVEEYERNVTKVFQTPKPPDAEATCAATPVAAQPTIPLADQTVPPILEELKAIGPASNPAQVRRVAWRLANHLRDVASVAYYLTILAQVVAGVAVERLVAAFMAADRAVGKVRKPGAIFATTWASWQPSPLPSQVRYYQQPSHPPAPPVVSDVAAYDPPAPVVDIQSPTDRETEVAELQAFAANPRHPFARLAGIKLAEIGRMPQ
jgi:hypothetical protein